MATKKTTPAPKKAVAYVLQPGSHKRKGKRPVEVFGNAITFVAPEGTFDLKKAGVSLAKTQPDA